MQKKSKTSKKVLIIGGGFGGLRAAQELRRAPVDITLVDKTNHHLFQPLLYQVATAGLTAEQIAVPIRSVLNQQKNTRVLLGEVTRVDLHQRRATLADNSTLEYDFLIVAAGARTNYYGHNDWQAHTVGLKVIEDAFEIRRRVLLAFEAAEKTADLQERQRLLTFVVIGGGPTGVEMAGALCELSKAVLDRDFNHLQGHMIRVILLEMGPRLLAPFHPNLSENARQELTRLGVEVRTNVVVTNIDATGVHLGDEHIAASMVCWAAGVEPRSLAKQLGVKTDARGFVPVEQDCSIANHPEAFVIGDMAAFVPKGQTRALPGVAPVALQQAVLVAANIKRTLKNQARRPFVYFDKGMMATIGTSKAVLQQGRLRMTGLLAWLAWCLVHVYYIVGFKNRMFVLLEWLWSYLTRRRGARLITNAT